MPSVLRAGGMLASYHRVVKPDIFAAAIASSAPNNYVIGTPDWAQTSERYHKHLAYSFQYHSGSHRCGSTIRQGFDQMLELARTAEGRQELANLFSVCKPDEVLETYADGFSFYMQQYDGIVAGAAQVGKLDDRTSHFSRLLGGMWLYILHTGNCWLGKV
eukprot:GHUV01056500.1.p1 GENE.GHUV01056500.1~~GHUV01056500.1.p1  ORF type:complete len:160 (-),score=26.19 GHUV01056500.1:90-569(-)